MAITTCNKSLIFLIQTSVNTGIISLKLFKHFDLCTDIFIGDTFHYLQV